ncbi:hypothetical protein WJX84_001967 [Apatococcus fuscideae]|uniref:FAD-binding FR-type domain-containing protein n=1 Tax=Apatococcus fuscideae TaxID=2026836 RepID=A0AAW1RUB1_9CHLO
MIRGLESALASHKILKCRVACYWYLPNWCLLRPSGGPEDIRRAPWSSQRRSRCAVTASKQEINWTNAFITSTKPAAEGLQSVTVDIGKLAGDYKKPGQFIQVRVNGSKPGFFAIASPPDENNQGLVELLIKRQGETAEAICSVAEGGNVDVSHVMGKGFPMDKAPHETIKELLIFATGSGISPIRSLIESGIIQADKRKAVRLYYGTKNESHTAFRNRIPDWQDMGVTVKHVYSDEDRGYVQQIFKEDQAPEANVTAAILAGQKDMADTVIHELTSLGVDKDLILTNF